MISAFYASAILVVSALFAPFAQAADKAPVTEAEGDLIEAKAPVTGSATEITQTSAKLRGRFFGGTVGLIPYGLTEGHYFANCGSLPNFGTQSCIAKNLKCGTKYYYIAITLQERGSPKSFTTKKCSK